MTAEVKPPIWKQKINVEEVKREGLEVDLTRIQLEGYESLTPEDFYRLKTWGICSQRTPGYHMIRIRIPGGPISVAQLRGVAELSAQYADGAAHITSRQNLELHYVPTGNLPKVLEGLGRLGLTTRSACGHCVRNIVGCTKAGICADEVFDIRPTVEAIHKFYLARSSHYNSRLPRRLNVYVAGCAACMSDAQINDLGFVATRRGGEPGFQFWCGGSLASNPRLSHLLFGFVPIEEALAVTEAVSDVYCAHGFRDRPSKARLKHLIEEWGVERFAATVMERLREIRPGTRVARNGLLPVLGPDRRPAGGHSGVSPQRQPGFVRIEARVRLGDLDGFQMKTLATLAEAYGDGYIYLTIQQNAELHWVREDAAPAVMEKLEAAGLVPRGAGSLVDVKVCAGSEWCVWGIGDSRGLARQIEDALAEIAAVDPVAEPLRIHISGCFHGCAQHQAADIGLEAVRSSQGAGSEEGFEVFGGGRLGPEPSAGKRLGRVQLPVTQSTVTAVLRAFLTNRLPGENFASFVERAGKEVIQAAREVPNGGGPHGGAGEVARLAGAAP